MDHKFIKAKRFFSEIKKIAYLYKELWRESTTALLHAPRGVDKTKTALSIASDVAVQGSEVLYINAENRLDNLNSDCDNLYIYTPEFESIDDTRDYADIVFEAIEEAVRTTSIRTFVIDSVSRIAALSFGRNSSVAFIMKRLVALQVKCKLTLLVVADDTTKSANNALLNLAASEIIINEEEESPVTVKTDGQAFTHVPQSQIKLPKAPIRMTRQQRRALERKQLKNKKITRQAFTIRNYE